jgi:chromosome segregation ATPase
MTDSPKDELEKLQKLRAELESRLATIDEEQETVEEESKILREKTAIRELEKKIREKQDALASLRIEKKELEDNLKAPNRLSISEAIQKTKAEIENKKDTLETEKEEGQKSESDETQEEENSKKKLRFF